MKSFFQEAIFITAIALATAACDTNTIDFGSLDNVEEVVSERDQIITGTSTYKTLSSKTISLGAVRANSQKCYFGQVTDPETGVVMRADYAAQLHCYEGSNFPERDSLVCYIEDKAVECDSVELLMYYNTWYGAKDAILKVNVQPLSMNEENILPENNTFYTDIDLTHFTQKAHDGSDSIMATKAFTIWDYTFDESELTSSTHTHCARVRLPKSYGDELMKHYYERPQDFADTWNFTRNVCAGFYMQLAGGDGAMVAVSSTSLNVYYRFEQGDSIYNGYTNFVGSIEVVQATHFETQGLDNLIADGTCTYVSSPAGATTELTLPIDEIFAGHEADSLARVQITMMRYNSTLNGTDDSQQVFDTPAILCMLMKADAKHFFEKGNTLKGRTFATASYNSNLNCYDFSNVARLVTYMKEQRELGVEDADKVVLVPVTINTNSASSTVVSVLNDMSVTSARLVGGTTPIDVNVTYSRYK